MLEYWMPTIIFAFVCLIIALFAAWYIRRRNNPKKKAGTGREASAGRVAGAAKSFARSNDYRIIAPAQLARKGMVAKLDAIVIGYFGVLGFVSLGYNGEIYGMPDDDEWLQVADDGTRTYFQNPIDECSADVRVIRDALFGAKIKNIPVEVIPVFADPKVQLAVPKDTGHYTMKTLKEYLNKEKFTKDAGHDLDKVEAAIREAMVG